MLGLLVLSLNLTLLTEVAGESLEDGGRKKWNLQHIFFSTIILILLVKIKNWLVVEYIKWMFDNKADKFLSQIKSRNYIDCDKMKWALWKDCRRYCKTKGGGKGKTIYKHYGERFNKYFAKLDKETHVISQIKGCKLELAAILRLEQIDN